MKKAILLILISSLAFLTSCNKLENNTQSASKLILASLTGYEANGTTESQVAMCDVWRSGVFNDNATATVSAELLNPAGTPTYYNDVIVDQVDISFTRLDSGSNVPGVGVPFASSRQVNFQVTAGVTASSFSFILLSWDDKTTPPLSALFGSGEVIHMTAKITLHGKDVAGYRVEPVTGYLDVWCADFGDA